MLHSSERRFSIGVPVSANLWSASRLFTARVVSAAGFLIYCASSSAHMNRRRLDQSSISIRSRSYEVTSTSTRRWPPNASRRAARRSCAPPATATTESSGANRSNSAVQLYTSDAGHTIRLGYGCRLAWRAKRREMSCSDLPKPISSAKTPPKSASQRAESQRKPDS